MDENIMQFHDETRRETSRLRRYLARSTIVGESVMKLLGPVAFPPIIS